MTVVGTVTVTVTTPGAPGLYWPLYGGDEYWAGAEVSVTVTVFVAALVHSDWVAVARVASPAARAIVTDFMLLFLLMEDFG